MIAKLKIQNQKLKIFAAIIVLNTVSCGQTKKSDSVIRPEAATVPNRAGDRDLLAAIDLQSRASEGQIAGSCLNILTTAGQDVFSHNESSRSVESAVFELSKLSKTELRDAHLAYAQHTRGKSESANAAFAKLDTSGKLGLSRGTSSSDANFNFDESHKRLLDFLSVHQSSASDFSHDVQVMKASFSEQGAAAYSRCITARGIGLTCDFEENDGIVSLHLMWAPHDLIRDKLPRIATKLVANENLVMVRDKFPETLGIGTGDVIAFRKVSKLKTALIQVLGSDASGEFSFQCSNFTK